MNKIKIEGYIDTDRKKVELEKDGLDVPNLIIVITALINSLYEEAKEEDGETINSVLHDVVDNPKCELEKQFDALELAMLLRGLAHIGMIKEREKK